MGLKIAAVVVLFAPTSAFAKEITFVNSGLSADAIVVLDVSGKTAKGTFRSKAIVDHRAHLFIPVHQRNYEGKTPRWEVSDMELEPEGE